MDINNIKYRKAILADTDSIFEIFQYWYHKYFTGDIKNGHLYSEKTWTKSDIQKTINESYISVAVHENKVVNFYLINHFLEIGNIAKRVEVIEAMIAKNDLPQGRYAFSLAAATHHNYLGMGLNRNVLNFLRDMVKDKYDFFTGIMSYDNTATQVSGAKMGWLNFGDISIGLLGVIGTTEDRTKLLKEYHDKL